MSEVMMTDQSESDETARSRSRLDMTGGLNLPPGLVPSLSKEDLYDLLWKRAEQQQTDEHITNNDVKRDKTVDHFGSPHHVRQLGDNPFHVTRDVKGQPVSAWGSTDDRQRAKEQNMTPTQVIQVQTRDHADIDEVVHMHKNDKKSSASGHSSLSSPPASPVGIINARKLRRVHPQPSEEGKFHIYEEPAYAQIDRKGKKKQEKQEKQEKRDKLYETVPMQHDQPRLLKVREITSPERQQASRSSSSVQVCHVVPPVTNEMSKSSLASKRSDGYKRSGNDYADPSWVYEELTGLSERKSENVITSTPRTLSSPIGNVTDDDCFTEQQLIEAESHWPAGPGASHNDNPITSSSMTPLHYAAAMGKRRYLLELLKNIANNTDPVLRLVSPDGKQQVQDVSRISCDTMNSIDCVDGHGRSALMHAVYWNQVDCARVLLHEGADVNQQTPDGSTVLHQCAYSGFPELIDLLLHHRADAHKTDKEGRCPLHWATNNSSSKVLTYLLDKVIDVNLNVRDRAEMTPLMWAAYNSQSAHVQALLERGTDVSLVDIDGMAAIHWSVYKNDTSCLKLLLTQESSCFRDYKGKTVIHCAAELGSASCIAIIMAVRPTSVDDTDNDGRTALHWAAACEKPEVIRTLLAGQGNPNLCDHNGYTPYDIAVLKKYHYCALLLAGQTQGVTDCPFHSYNQASSCSNGADFHLHSVEHDAELSSLGQQDAKKVDVSPQAHKLIKFLTIGCWLGKFTNYGRGPLHNRFFWVNLSNGSICWSVHAEPSSKEVKSELLVDMKPTPSSLIAGRKDYDPASRHQYAFSLLTPNRVLNVVACCEEDYRLWVEGLQYILAMGVESAALLYKTMK
ncbi:uncharacterized protein LOC134189518 isoform X2 [Corticium candelabrum]|uniref:uncharacterized protein LOC134189518 isoform X2 n=1 Tax=Corticium candelabrum TaxID=121492 RepID=UPI002E276615|nr:uncharacterized protein LOC134189518 isoform X2 [Corticium candelabrum]